MIALIVNMVAQLLSARVFRHGGYIRSVLAGFLAGFVGLLALAGLVFHYQPGPWQEAVANLLVNTCTYTALAFCFLAFVNLGKTSIRIRIFRELQQSKLGLSPEQLLSLYDYRIIVELRLERLLKNKQVIEREDRYFLNGLLIKLLAVTIRSAKMLVLGKTGEFQSGKERGR